MEDIIREYLENNLRIDVVDEGSCIKVRLLIEDVVVDWDYLPSEEC